MDTTQNWNNAGNLEEGQESNHGVNMAVRAFCNELENMGIPVFIAYYLPDKGYKYRAAFPEEIGTPDVESQYGKFKEFLRVCIGFNKEDYIPDIKTNLE